MAVNADFLKGFCRGMPEQRTVPLRNGWQGKETRIRHKSVKGKTFR
jgi:hypothetical protein